MPEEAIAGGSFPILPYFQYLTPPRREVDEQMKTETESEIREKERAKETNTHRERDRVELSPEQRERLEQRRSEAVERHDEVHEITDVENRKSEEYSRYLNHYV